jgi:hypothetical protein
MKLMKKLGKNIQGNKHQILLSTQHYCRMTLQGTVMVEKAMHSDKSSQPGK